MVQRGAIKLQYVGTNEQVADVLTKPLSRVNFEHFRDKLGIVRKDLPQKGSSVVLRYASLVLCVQINCCDIKPV
jgi:hypothetical protein